MSLNKLFQLLRRSRTDQAPSAGHGEAYKGAFAAEPPPAAPRLDRLELQGALIHHLEWCVQFNDHLGLVNQSETPPPRLLPGADDSELGQWLARAATRTPGTHPLFAELVRAHQHFHELADEALKLAAEGRMDLASTLLNTDFERSRAKVLGLLRDMQKAG
ncbi:MAG: CZB domain-containing protein [Hydrogenophaga sp.]|uniref:CZB domain-containing protein n=1 Tax=Hydrogenophaga sp. TaxID=1904254 RepID=UPI003D9B0931